MDSTAWINKQKFKDIFRNRIMEAVQANKLPEPSPEESDELIVLSNGMYAQGLEKMGSQAGTIFETIEEDIASDIITALESKVKDSLMEETIRRQAIDTQHKIESDVIRYKIEFIKTQRRDLRNNLTELKVLLQGGKLTMVAINDMIMNMDEEMLRKLSALSRDLPDGVQNGD